MSVDLLIERTAARLLPAGLKKRRIKQLAVAVLKLLGESERELSLLFTDDRVIAQLNLQYRHKPKPTDVLSFAVADVRPDSNVPASQADSGSEIPKLPLGDIVISVETAIVQADRYGVTLEAEILRLLIHGTLHLLGYEHEKVPSHIARKMRKKEAEVFAALAGI